MFDFFRAAVAVWSAPFLAISAANCVPAAPAIKNQLCSEGGEAPVGWTQTWTANGKAPIPPALSRLICLEGSDESSYRKAAVHLEEIGGIVVGEEGGDQLFDFFFPGKGEAPGVR